jgi:hypothetical protein
MNEDSLRHELKVYKASLEQQVAPPGMVSARVSCRASFSQLQCFARSCAGNYVPAGFGAREVASCVHRTYTAHCICSRGQHTCAAHDMRFLLCFYLQALNEDGCMLGAKIVWMTLMETRSVRRWAACKSTPCSRAASRHACSCALRRPSLLQYQNSAQFAPAAGHKLLVSFLQLWCTCFSRFHRSCFC